MGSVSKLAVIAALSAAGVLTFAAPAAAQRAAAPASAYPSVNRAEYEALAALEAALSARNYSAAASALATAQSAARSSDARYYLAGLQLRYARETGNAAAQASAIDALISSGRVSGAELGPLYAAQGSVAATAGKREQAEAAFTRAMEAAPSAENAISLARVKLDLRKNAEAVTLLDRAVQLRKASGQPVPESWYRRGVSLSTMNNLPGPALAFARQLVAAYPSPENWRDALLTYRDIAKPDAAGQLDAVRLLRLSRGMAGERDYLEAAQTFDAAGLAGESRSVLDEGVSTKMVDPAKAASKAAIATATRKAAAEKAKLATLQAGATAAATGAPALQAGDVFLGAGNYTAAADLFRAAVVKGGVDANVANTRLGTALALAGRKAEAEAAFRAVTGPRAELAALWLVWLGQRT
jgi:tetratricopeptide (TPR) repeat protein